MTSTHSPLWRSCGGVIHCGAHYHAWIVIRAVRLVHHHKHRVFLGPGRAEASRALDDSLSGGSAVTATCLADSVTVMPSLDGWTSTDVDDLRHVFVPEIADAAADALELAGQLEQASVLDSVVNAPGGSA